MQRLDLVEDSVDVGRRELSILRPRDSEALLDEEAFEREEFLPYWAEVWPSGVALARFVAGEPLSGARVLELGCGLALPTIAAALAGARALASDWAPDAIALVPENARRNGVEIETALVSWARPDPLLARAPFDLVLAADVLYERRDVPLLLDLLPRLGSRVLLADPGRPAADDFLELASADWEIERVAEDPPRVSVYRLSPGPVMRRGPDGVRT
jgi:predicted nicotinamide N-methyase